MRNLHMPSSLVKIRALHLSTPASRISLAQPFALTQLLSRVRPPSPPALLPRRLAPWILPSTWCCLRYKRLPSCIFIAPRPSQSNLPPMASASPVGPLPPNEIPRRTSSIGLRHHQQRQSTSLVPIPPVAQTMPEDSWLASSRRPPAPIPASIRNPAGESARSAGSTAGGMQHIGEDLVNARKPAWSEWKENIIQGPYSYLHNHPGKDIRSQMISAFDAVLRVPPSSLEIITKVVGMLHTSSLLVDDVEDSSQLRRGVPCAHVIFGVAQTVNTANYVYFLALKELAKLRRGERAIEVYAEEMVNLHRGQGMDLFWRDSATCPEEDDYLEMVSNKTGGLFRLAIKLMQVESEEAAFALSPSNSGPSTPEEQEKQGARRHALIPLVNTMGLIFQILDDYQNLQSASYTTNKGLAEDLTEGKYSFPIIHAIRAEPSDRILSNILQQRPRDDEVKRYAVKHIERCGSFAYTRRVLEILHGRAMELVDQVDRVATAEAWREGERRKGDGVRAILEKLRVPAEPDDLVSGHA